jgi:hypothetical protein
MRSCRQSIYDERDDRAAGHHRRAAHTLAEGFEAAAAKGLSAIVRRDALLCAAVGISSIALMSYVWLVFLPAGPEAERVSFEVFESDIDAGNVIEVRIHESKYSYLLYVPDRQTSIHRQTVGPKPSIASVQKLRPSKNDARAPNIYFEE